MLSFVFSRCNMLNCSGYAEGCVGNETLVGVTLDKDSHGVLHQVLGVVLTSLLALVVFSLGCTVKLDKLWSHLRRPWGVLVGLLCQFGLMPLTAHLLSLAFAVRPVQALAVLIMGCCPGGTISNIITYWIDGDMDLSITMTSCSTVLGLGMMPLCLYIYTRFWVETGNIKVPYFTIGVTLITLIAPVSGGVFVNYKWPKAARTILKVGTVLGALLILVVGIASAVLYKGSWNTDTSMLIIGAVFPVIGYTTGFIIAVIVRQPWHRCRTVAMETGAQNVQICSTMLQLSFPPEQLVHMFTFPLIYGSFQLFSGLLLVTVYQTYKRMALQKPEDSAALGGHLQAERSHHIVQGEVNPCDSPQCHRRRRGMDTRALSGLTQACAAVLLLATAQAGEPVLSHLWGREYNVTHPGGAYNWPLIKGFASLGLCVIGFGSSLVPVKKTDTGDGLFFQWVFCSSMWLTSSLAHVILGCPRFWLLGALGGALWSMGNLTTIPILQTVGLGLGILIWSTTCLLMGWASARFGWFGLDQQDVPSPTLNYIGTALATISALILFLVRTETEKGGELDETEPLLQSKQRSGTPNQLDSAVNERVSAESSNGSWANRLSSNQRKIFGFLLAACAGVMYGCSYTPITYIKNKALRNDTHFSGASQYDLDYIFSFCTGVYIMSSIAFFGYCMAMKNRPNLPTQCVLPAFFSGSMMAASNCFWLVACSHLGTIITFPIGTAGPSFVSLMWSVFYFREIKGTKNFLILAGVLVTILSGMTLITISKIL
ncbi:hypothetical protein SKAU_G00357380 [Synaphobranchus kaupii]|uniref:Solute carrier family 10 member 6 n=1 Tax=Synaphobranchus kaupii TaxID=118154 RepID=A0A9Q1EHP2_SYNKA|nr:hypothetical protein SKAU_G00357380 [Synaphobranchus kaupii]